jgi:hypothetical protein
MRGTPHVHSLVWIGDDGITEESVNSEDIAEQQKVKKLMKKTVSAILVDEVDTLDEVEIEPKKQKIKKRRKNTTGIHIEITMRKKITHAGYLSIVPGIMGKMKMVHSVTLMYKGVV